MEPYDNWLVGGTFLVILGGLQWYSNLAGRTKLWWPMLIILGGGYCLYQAYEISEQTLTIEALPDSFYRVMGQFISKEE